MIHTTTYALTTTGANGQPVTHTHTVATTVEPLRDYTVEFRRCHRHAHREGHTEAACIWKRAEWARQLAAALLNAADVMDAATTE